MRSIWKGFVIGGLTGAAIGLVRDRDRQDKTGDDGTTAGAPAPSTSSTFPVPDDVWKGFIFGALTGSGVGLLVDLGDWVRNDVATSAVEAGRMVRERAPEVAHQVAESDAAKSVADAAHYAAEHAPEVARKVEGAVSGFADDATKSVQERLRA